LALSPLRKPGTKSRIRHPAGDWKLIWWYEDDRFELYNIKHDIGEKNNLATQQPERLRLMKQKLNNWLEAMDAKKCREQIRFIKRKDSRFASLVTLNPFINDDGEHEKSANFHIQFQTEKELISAHGAQEFTNPACLYGCFTYIM
jgi:hypothetical protein